MEKILNTETWYVYIYISTAMAPQCWMLLLRPFSLPQHCWNTPAALCCAVDGLQLLQPSTSCTERVFGTRVLERA